MSTRHDAAAALLLALSLAPGDHALAAEWFAYTSDNFTVYSDRAQESTVALLSEFEVFRKVALGTLGLPDVPENERLTIVLFAWERDYGRIKGSLPAVGFFYHSIFGPRMIVGPAGRGIGAQDVLFHEYVHHLMNQRSTLNYPRWYQEGLASLLETTEFDESGILVGKAPAQYVQGLELGVRPNLRDVLEPGSRGDYLTSWLMTHYLLLSGDRTRRQHTTDYLRRYDAGEDPVQAFTDSFGMSVSDMQGELMAYSRRRMLGGFTWPRIQYTGVSTRRALEDGADMYLLGDLALETGQHDGAHYYFERFEDLEIDSPLSASVKAKRAIVYIHEKKVERGDALIAQVLALHDESAAVLADIAHYEFDRYVYDRDNGGNSGLTHLNRAIEYGERAVQGDPGDIEALYYLGLSHELNGNLQAAADTLLNAYDISPSIPRLNVNLARVLLKGGQEELASYLVGRLYSSTHSAEIREKYRAIQQEIASGNVDWEKLDVP